MKAADLKTNSWYKYQDCDETCNAKVEAIDHEKRLVYFVDDEEFQWEDSFDDIPTVIIKKLPF